MAIHVACRDPIGCSLGGLNSIQETLPIAAERSIHNPEFINTQDEKQNIDERRSITYILYQG
jgi:hypothetical protein